MGFRVYFLGTFYGASVDGKSLGAEKNNHEMDAGEGTKCSPLRRALISLLPL